MPILKKAKKEKKPKKEKRKNQENQEGQEKAKKAGGKKKLLLIPVALILIAAAAFAVVRFVLPRFVGGDGDEKKPTVLETYTIGEASGAGKSSGAGDGSGSEESPGVDSAPAIDTVLEEGEGVLLAKRGPEWLKKLDVSGGKDKDAEEDGSAEKEEEPKETEERYTYIYEMTNYAAVVDRYLDVMLGSEQGFSLVDETYLIQEDRPELSDEEGALMLARASVQEGHIFQVVIGWSQATGNLAVRVSAPEGALKKPEKPNASGPEQIQAASITEQLETLKGMTPKQLALSGSSMDEYDIYPMEGFVNIDGNYCRRFTIYEKGQSSDIASIIFLSGDQQHVYRMDVDDNSIITELKQTRP